MSTPEIARCDQEIERCRTNGCDQTLSPSQKLGAIQGEVDWMVAKQMAEEKAYEAFLESKAHSGNTFGFEPLWIPNQMFGFQASLLDWSLRKGRADILADCGLGKTFIELAWAENVVRKTNRPVLLLTPLAVAAQTIREGEKFGIEASRDSATKIIVANYEQLHKFDPNDFAGVVCDESSILKSFDGVRRGEITEFLKKMPYRLLASATASPNDYHELGTQSEALGELGYMDMLMRFFKNDQHTVKPMRYTGFGNPRSSHPPGREHTDKWRFKGHAEIPFFRWVCSWARACRKPSDLGFPDDDFILPPLTETEHVVEARTLADGMLFALPAIGLKEQRDERRRTLTERCERMAELVASTGKQALIWCQLNDEGDLLEHIIPGAVQVSGKDSDQRKEEKFLDFTANKIRVLITKMKIGGWGLNFQNCAHVLMFPDHSFEQYYQGVRRCWRFGQVQSVHVDMIITEGQKPVIQNLRRKAAAADQMFTRLIEQMHDATQINRQSVYQNEVQLPSWL